MRYNNNHGNLAFSIMSLEFKIRDWILAPELVLRLESDIKPGMKVLDFGCGPGGFTTAAAKLVGPEGMVYALDINPRAICAVEREKSRLGLDNIKTVFGNRMYDIPMECLDMVLLYDIIHDLPDSQKTLSLLHHLIKPGGIIYVRDNHLKEDMLLSKVISGGLYKFIEHNRSSYSFEKI